MRDLGVGRDVFSDGTGSAMKRVRPQSAAFSRSMKGADLFGDDANAAAGPALPADVTEVSESRRAALAAAHGNGGMVAIAEDVHCGTSTGANVSQAKLRDLGVGCDVFRDAPSARKVTARKARVPPAAQGNGLFAEDDTDPSAIKFGGKVRAGRTCARVFVSKSFESEPPPRKPFRATRRPLVSSSRFLSRREARRYRKGVSEALKESLASKVFDAPEENPEANEKPDEATAPKSRCTAWAHHEGHGIFSDSWVQATESEGMETEEGGAGGETAAEPVADPVAFATPKPVKTFKPIGAATPAVDFRWKTAEEEEAEELVGALVRDAIASVIAAGAGEETTA